MSKQRRRRWILGIMILLALAGISFAVSDKVRFVVCGITGAALYGWPGEDDRGTSEGNHPDNNHRPPVPSQLGD